MPPIVWAQHKYVTQYVLTAESTTGLTGTEYAIRLNSLFDPEFTAVGHQPRGFDQMAAMMKRYCVYKVDVQVKVVDHNPTAVCMMNVRSSGGGYSLTNKLPYQESENGTVAFIEADRANSFTQSYYIADIEGKNRQAVFTEDKYSALVTADPLLPCYMSVACGSANGTGGGVNCTVMISLVYHTRWSERINLSIS